MIDFESIQYGSENNQINWVLDFYSIALKKNFDAKINYGQQEYDFDDGVLFFISPNQVYRIEVDENQLSNFSGWMLLIHPDFFWKTSLAQNIRKYNFFDYSVNEALFQSEKEEGTLNVIIQNIQNEYHSNSAKASSFHKLRPCSITPKGFTNGSSLREG